MNILAFPTLLHLWINFLDLVLQKYLVNNSAYFSVISIEVIHLVT